ncbi:MAG: hypothetical protein LUG57_08970 [Oscillospiraceae bacterium]|nr:hypothetical protein [Oscillospiraceae bacterium]
MRKFLKAVLILLLLALLGLIIAGVVYFGENPDIFKEMAAETGLDELLGKVGIHLLEEAESVSVPDEADIEIDYDFPHSIYNGGIDVQNDRAVAYFKSVGGELWLTWRGYDCGDSGGFVYNQNGWVKNLSAEEITTLPDTEEVGLSASALADLAAGSYYICITPDNGYDPVAYYVEVYDQATFTPSTPAITTTDNSSIDALADHGYLYYFQTDPQDIVIHLNNLDENTITQVFDLTLITYFTGSHYNYANMPEGSYEISDDGCTVTLKAEYLADLDHFDMPYFALRRQDGTDIILDGSEDAVQDNRQIFILRTPNIDFPNLEGPEIYSLSSGEDLTITFHMGIASSVYSSNYWEPGEDGIAGTVATVKEIESGQFTIPYETVAYYYEHYGYIGFTVVMEVSLTYMWDSLYIELTA